MMRFFFADKARVKNWKIDVKSSQRNNKKVLCKISGLNFIFDKFLCSPHARRAVSFLDLHSGPKVASSHTKINENFANYFIKTKAQNQVHYISGKYKCKVFVSYGGKIKGKCVATLQRQSSLESSCSCLDLCACSLLAYKMHFVVGLCAAVHSAYFVDHLN